MQLIDSFSFAEHTVPLPKLPSCASCLSSASAGLTKVKNAATWAFSHYAPPFGITLWASLATSVSWRVISTVAVGVALLNMNFNTAFEAEKAPASLQPARVTTVDGSYGICSVIKAIALTTLKEIAALVAVTAVAACFVGTELGVAALAVGALAVVCTNLFLRTLGGVVFLINAETDPVTKQRTLSEGKAKKFIDFIDFVAPLSYGFMHFQTLSTVVHESGHALAANVLYAGADTEIVLFPFVGAVTLFKPQALSCVGNLLGATTANILIAAAGPAAAIGEATVEILLADQFEKTHPRLSRYLKIMGCLNIVKHIFYANSAFEVASSAATASPVSGHDFVRLWSANIHPYASIVSMLAVPLIFKLGIFLATKSTNTPEVALNTK